MMVDWLIDHDKEEPYLDFKEALGISKNSPFPKIAKDIFAFSNYGGGFILIGFRHKSKFPELAEKTSEDSGDEKPEYLRDYVPVGLGESYHVDQAALQEKFNAYSLEALSIDYREFTRVFEGIPRGGFIAQHPIGDGVWWNVISQSSCAYVTYMQMVIRYLTQTQLW
ncbi:MAG: hypothetical protein ACREBQ_03915 [Nitrososphaerales archaeon]